jgi:hypothetical protein
MCGVNWQLHIQLQFTYRVVPMRILHKLCVHILLGAVSTDNMEQHGAKQSYIYIVYLELHLQSLHGAVSTNCQEAVFTYKDFV